jgi:hypothetical protein
MEVAMETYRYSFGPEEIGRMTDAYEHALRVLQVRDRSDPVSEIIAKKIIKIASKTRESDPGRMSALAIKELQN